MQADRSSRIANDMQDTPFTAESPPSLHEAVDQSEACLLEEFPEFGPKTPSHDVCDGNMVTDERLRSLTDQLARTTVGVREVRKLLGRY